MKAKEAPEKIFIFEDELQREDHKVMYGVNQDKGIEGLIEYTRTDTFVKKALKWYCLDCECNDNCKDTKCFFYREYERYLKGEANAAPPKFSDRIIEEDASISVNYRYRHFISRLQESFIEKACKWLKDNITYIHPRKETKECVVNLAKFKDYMKGE